MIFLLLFYKIKKKKKAKTILIGKIKRIHDVKPFKKALYREHP